MHVLLSVTVYCICYLRSSKS